MPEPLPPPPFALVAPAGAGGGKSGGTPRAAREAPDTLRSIAYARGIYLVSEGPIQGLAKGLKGIYLGGTPVENEDGTRNFEGFAWYFLPGEQDQNYLPGFETAENEIPAGLEIKATGPVHFTATITTPSVNAARLTLRIPTLTEQNTTNGDLNGSTVTVRVRLQSNGGGYVTKLTDTITGKSAGAYQRSYRVELEGAPPWDVRMERVSADAPAAIQNKTIVDSYAELTDGKLRYTHSALLATEINAEQFPRIEELAGEFEGRIIEVPVNYDPVSRQYAGVWDGTWKLAYTDNPAWCFRDLLLHERYGLGEFIAPDMVDKWALYTIARYCDGVVPTGFAEGEAWGEGSAGSGADRLVFQGDGNLVLYAGAAAVWSSGAGAGVSLHFQEDGNLVVYPASGPATWASGTSTAPWAGVGLSYGPNTVVLNDGESITVGYHRLQLAGGRLSLIRVPSEPRFRCNLYLQTREQALKVLQDLASIFRGMVYYGSGTVVPVQDAPVPEEGIAAQFAPENVVAGEFDYSSTSRRARHTVALVTWSDPDQLGKSSVEYVEELEGVLLHGVRELNLTAIGCTSRSQAHRLGKWALLTEKYLTESVTFKAGFEGAPRQPFEVVRTSDEFRAGRVVAGRIRHATTAAVVLDRTVTIEAGKSYALACVLPDGTMEERPVFNAGPSTPLELGVAPAFSVAPLDQTVWILKVSDLQPEKWRVLAIEEEERHLYKVAALAYNDSIYDAVERDLQFVELPSSALPSAYRVEPPRPWQASPLVPIGFSVLPVTTPTDHAVFLEFAWQPSPDRFLRGYLVRVRKDHGNWQPLPETPSATARCEITAPGLYEVEVVAVNTVGGQSAALAGSYTLTPASVVFQVINLAVQGTPFREVAGSAATDTFTCPGHGLIAGDSFVFSYLTGGAGLSVGATYYVVAAGLTSSTFRLSATRGGGAVNFTTDTTLALGYRTTFRGRELALAWEVVPPAGWLGPATNDPFFAAFRVTVERWNGTAWDTVRTEDTRDARYVYTPDRMAEDFPPDPGATAAYVPPHTFGIDPATGGTGGWGKYRFGVRVLNRFGDLGTPIYLSPTNPPPASVTSLAAAAANGVATLTWDNPAEADLTLLVIYELAADFSWEVAIGAVPAGSRQFLVSRPAGTTRRYRVAAVDWFSQGDSPAPYTAPVTH